MSLFVILMIMYCLSKILYSMQSPRLKGLLVAILCTLSYTFSVAQITTVPYFEGFEDPTTYSSWNLDDVRWNIASPANKWFIGTATSFAGSHSMYISVDGSTTTYSGTGVTRVSKQSFNLPAGSYDLSFAWKCNGDGTDALYVFWIPESQGLQGSTSELSTANVTSALEVTVDGAKSKALKNSTTWKIATATIQSTGVPMKLCFVWSQNGSNEGMPPGCVDNVQIAKPNCKPSNITAVVQGKDVVVSWSGTANSYEVEYRPFGSSTSTVKRNITGNSVTLPNLGEGVYDIMVRGLCPPDTSMWVVKTNILIYDPLAHCLDFIDLDAAECRYGTFANPHQTLGKVDYGPNSTQSRHTVNTDPTATDPNTNGGLTTIPPGEVVSIRLGNSDTGAQAESITYNYTVDSGAKQILILKYAVVLEDPNHGASEQPKFTLELLDENGRQLDRCGVANFIASASLPGWHREQNNYDVVMWKDWTTTGVNLTPYAANGSKNIKIRLTTYDCSQSGHFGYAYFSLNCADAKISGISCGAVATASVSAPIGFNYEWTKASDPNTVICTTKELSVTSTDTSLYYCKVISQDDPTCNFTLEANLLPNYPKARFVPKWTPKDCKNYITFQNSSAIWTDRGETGKKCETTYWDFGNGQKVTGVESPVVEFPNEGGTFTAKLIVGMSDDQCQDSLLVQYTVPAIKPTNDTILAKICYGQVYLFDGKRLNRTGIYESRNKNVGGCDSIVVLDLEVVAQLETEIFDTICAGETYTLNNQTYSKTGTYKATVQTASGCDSVTIVNLFVYDPVEFNYTVKDEDTGPQTGEIIITDTLTTWTREVNGVPGGSLDSLVAGVYEVVYINESGCRSKPVRIEVNRQCLVGNFGAVPKVCADDSSFQVVFDVVEGAYSSYNLRFDADAKAAGFTDVDSLPNNGIVEIEVPESVRPNTYKVRVDFVDPTCGEHPEVLEFDILYSSAIMAQKFNDVIALLNSKYNGGYDFVSYQWYKNGQPIVDATHSYLYIGPEETLNINDSYSVSVVRAGETKAIMSCELIPTTHQDQHPYIKQNIAGVRQNLPIPPSSENGEAIWWSVSGQMIERAPINAYDEYIITPYQQGVYILELRYSDSRELYKVFVK